MQLLALLLAMTASSVHSGPGMILVNGKIWTGDPAQRFVESVAISGERILATGSTKAMRKLAGPGTRVIDLKGKLHSLPGSTCSCPSMATRGFGLSWTPERSSPSARTGPSRLWIPSRESMRL